MPSFVHVKTLKTLIWSGALPSFWEHTFHVTVKTGTELSALQASEEKSQFT